MTHVEKLSVMTSTGYEVESTLIQRPDKNILCFSTQVGCPMECRFCVSGLGKYVGNLTVQDMLVQIEPHIHTLDVLSAMGEGEPAYNARNVGTVLKEFAGKRAVSTIAPSLRLTERLLREVGPDTKVQYSLHHGMNRPLTMGTNLADPVEVLELLKDHPVVELNFTLMAGINDSDEDAYAVCELLDEGVWYVKVNRFNCFPGSPYKPSLRVMRWMDIVKRSGLFVEYYETDGAHEQAACGQLSHIQRARE